MAWPGSAPCPLQAGELVLCCHQEVLAVVQRGLCLRPPTLLAGGRLHGGAGEQILYLLMGAPWPSGRWGLLGRWVPHLHRGENGAG